MTEIFLVLGAVSIGFVWVEHLTDEKGLLYFLDGDRIQDPRLVLLKKLLTCHICLSGQIALWSYPLLHFTGDLRYNVLLHILVTFSSMLFTSLIVAYYGRA